MLGATCSCSPKPVGQYAGALSLLSQATTLPSLSSVDSLVPPHFHRCCQFELLHCLLHSLVISTVAPCFHSTKAPSLPPTPAPPLLVVFFVPRRPENNSPGLQSTRARQRLLLPVSSLFSSCHNTATTSCALWHPHLLTRHAGLLPTSFTTIAADKFHQFLLPPTTSPPSALHRFFKPR
jgi:hypothetical protein